MTETNSETSTETTPVTEVKPSWYISEDMPGIGNRPDWLGEKFKTVKDLAISYSELEKKVVKEAPPENYDFSKSRYLDGDYEPFNEFKAFAKENRVSQSVVDKMLESVDKYMDEFTPDFKEEQVKLGENAKARLETLDNWMKETIDEESYNALTAHLTSADSIKALEKLRGKMMENNTTIPNGNDTSSSNVTSLADIQSEMTANIGKYKSDPVYRREIQRKIELAAKSSNFIDKSSQ